MPASRTCSCRASGGYHGYPLRGEVRTTPELFGEENRFSTGVTAAGEVWNRGRAWGPIFGVDKRRRQLDVGVRRLTIRRNC